MAINWSPILKLNIKIIDLQHQQLVKVTNQLLNLIDHPIPKDQLYYYFQEVINYTHYHFRTEEYFLKKFKCDPEQTKIHIQEHEKFKKEVEELLILSKTNQTDASFGLVHVLENWLIHHIPYVDQKYVDCFHQNNLY